MQMNFNRNIQFTKLLKADGRLREFNFRKLSGLHEGLMTVDVSDDRGNRIMFTMQKTDNGWNFYQERLFPEWILDHEQNLSDMIESELKQLMD